uniref:CG-1 domain-containing protein n=1 Tax=Chrysemys picta bellii TaxID=8478 RepID=A0A8C3P865_CHRPI
MGQGSVPLEVSCWSADLSPPHELSEIASYLITFERHEEWLSCSPKTRPQNGSIILYNRKKVKYRKDGYCWKKRKDGKTTREDHMKLKVQGMEVGLGAGPTAPSPHLPAVSLRLLRPLVHRPHIPPPLLLAAAGRLGRLRPRLLPQQPRPGPDLRAPGPGAAPGRQPLLHPG